MRVKMSKQPPPASAASAVGPCPTVIQVVGCPGNGSLPSTITHLSFTIKIFYVMGKALSGELSSSQAGLVLHFADINFCCLFFFGVKYFQLLTGELVKELVPNDMIRKTAS